MERFSKLERVGRGSYGEVYRGYDNWRLPVNERITV